MSRLLMPMGFCAILGGTITMVGSSPLILLNDLILTSNKALPAEQQMQTWSLFTVTPMGLALLVDRHRLFRDRRPLRFAWQGQGTMTITQAANAMEYFQRLYGLDYAVYREWPCRQAVRWSARRSMTSRVRGRLRVIALHDAASDDLRIGPGALDRTVRSVPAPCLACSARRSGCAPSSTANGLQLRDELETFADSAFAGQGRSWPKWWSRPVRN
jgi:hypothetical protein